MRADAGREFQRNESGKLLLIDIIIPVYNEEPLLLEKGDYYRWLKKKASVIFVDGGSQDRTADIAAQYGKVITAPRGRARQMNAAAREAKGHLLFLHADTFVDEQALSSVNYALENGVCGGCLTMQIDSQEWIFRVFEDIVNWRARRFKVIDGDLGLFVKRETFAKVNAFDEIPVMEDILFSQKLRRAGEVVMLPNIITVSARKWHSQGFVRTFLRYSLAYARLWMKQIKKR